MSNNTTDNPKELNADFKELEKTLLAVKDALKGLGSETKESGLEKLSKNTKAVAGGFTAAAESLKFFDLESDGLKEIEKKVKNITEVVGGLQLAFKTLGKAGGWITLVASAIAGLVSWYQKWKTENEEVSASHTKFTEEVKNSYKGLGDKMVTLKKLQTEWSKLGGSLDAQKKFIDANKTAFDSLGVAINDVNDANKLLVTNTPFIIEALKLQAQAKAAGNLANQAYEEKFKLEKEAQTAADKDPTDWEYAAGYLSLANPVELGKWVAGYHKSPEDLKQERVQEIKEDAVKKGKEAESFLQFQSNLELIANSLQTLSGVNLTNNKKNEGKAGASSGAIGDTINNTIVQQQPSPQISKEKKINEEMRALTAKNISDRIGLMDEGTQKELAKIEDQYNQIIAKIRQREQEWRDAQGGELTEEQKKLGQDESLNATNQRINDEEEVINRLTDKYKDYSDQRKSIEEQYNRNLADLRMIREKAVEDENDARVQEVDQMINNLVAKQGKELMTHDFNTLKENPDFSWAFENIKSTSSDTLNVLLEQLNAIQESNKGIDATKLKEYSGAIQQISDELATRNPVAALAKAQNQLTQANIRLAKAKQELNKANESGDKDAKAKAALEHAAALIEVDKANKDVTKSQKVVNEKMGELFKNLSGVGEAIGGQAGQIISLIGDIGTFVTTSISGIQKAGEAGAGALAAVEKASAILAIIQLAIQLMSKISSIMSDTHQQYEKYAKKLAEINKLRDAVNEYQLAVLKAKQAEDNWFGEDNLQSLKDAKIINNKVKESYDEKVNEKQAKYENEKGGGWLTNTSKWLGDAYQNTFGKIYDITIGKPSEFLLGKAGKFIAKTGEAASFGLGTQATLGKYNENEVRAIDNLRIETRSAKSGFLGSGIGGRSQKTEDLRTWARNNNFGELFDENNMINKEAAQAIIDAKGDKLVGETKETLESLIELKDQYDEYQQQLKDYVSSLYEPLVGNFVDSLWAWFDEGKDALTSFKEMAAGTFRDIVSDMIKTIVLKNVVGTYSDDIVDMYNQYAEGKLSEEQLMDKVAQRTDEMIDTYEEQIPALQNLMTTLSSSLNESGIDIQKKQEEKEQTAEKGSFQTMSQETGTELLGQFTAIRIHTSNMHELMKGMESENKLINTSLTAIEKNTYNTVDELKQVNNQLKQLKVEGIKVL